MMLRFNRCMLLSLMVAGTSIWTCDAFVCQPRLPSFGVVGNEKLFSSNDGVIDVDVADEDDDLEVGKMRVSEIKAELKLRRVDFSDCFDKESLSKRLLDARCKGKADPTIIDQFNQQSKKEGDVNKVLDDDVLKQAAGGDGTLPGGMPPDMLKALMGNPELVSLLQNPKMQKVMKTVMTDGQGALEEEMKNDPETYELIMKLNRIMGSAM